MNFKSISTLALAAGIAAFTTSCSDDEEDAPLGPELDVMEVNTNATGGEITIEQGQSLTFAWDARKGDSDLDVFAVTVTGTNAVTPLPESADGNTFPYELSNADDETYVDSLTFASAGLNVGLTTYTFTVTDTDGLTSSITFDVAVEAPITTTPLSAPEAFTWERVGGAAATGLAQFGLQWTSNSSSSAIVALDAATVMVELPAASYTEIETQEELALAIAEGTPITQYTGVSVQEDATYDDVLGVRYNGVDYLLQIQNGDVEIGSAGTIVTITGTYKD